MSTWRRKRFGFRSNRRPMKIRSGKPAEVSQYTMGYDLTLTAGTATLESPGMYVTQVISVASMVTDYNQTIEEAQTAVRSIPPHYRGVSVGKVSLDLDICVVKAPISNHVEGFDPVNGAWAGGWCRGAAFLYVDDFYWGTYETPDLNCISHAWQNDLIAGAAHTEYDRPKRILCRQYFTTPAVADIGTWTAGAYSGYTLNDRQGLHRRLRMTARKVYLTERSAIWLCICGSNPWTAIAGLYHDVEWGIVGGGRVIYRLRAG